MRIVKLSSLSEKERKKVLEEQEERYQQNQQERQKIQKQANDDFVKRFGNGDTNPSHTTTYKDILNSMNSKEAKSDFKKRNNLTLWDQVKNIANGGGFITRKTGTGILGGIVGIGQAGLTDTANQLRKGENDKSTNIPVSALDFISSVLNPSRAMNRAMIEGVKNNFSTITNKDKNVMQKAGELFTNSASAGVNMNQAKATWNTGLQLMGKINNNLDDEVLRVNGKISKPVEELNAKLQEEGKKYDGVTNWLGDAGQTVGNMVPSITASAVTHNPSIGLGVMGISAKGQATQEALNKGADLEQAVKIGDAKMLVEIATEKMAGGIKLLGKGSLDDLADEFIKKGSKSTFGKFLLKQGYNVGGEITEELISDLAGNIIDKGTTEPDKKIVDFKQGLDTAGKTAFTTLVLNGLGGYQQDYNWAKQQTLEQQNQNTDNKVINQEQKTSQNGFSQTETLRQEARNKLESIKQNYDENSYNQMQEFIETAPNEKALNQVISDLNKEAETKQVAPLKQETKNKLEETYKSERFTESQDRKRTYAQYQRQNNTTGIQYDNSVVDNALDAVAPNRNGRRTVGQWKQVAEQIGLNSADLTKSQIDDIAYGSWFDLQPTKNITRYDNRTKEHKGFEKFTSDDWINTIYESAKGQKIKQIDNSLINNEKTVSIQQVTEEDYLTHAPNYYDGEQFDYNEHRNKTTKKVIREIIDIIDNSSNIKQDLIKAYQENEKSEGNHNELKTGLDEDNRFNYQYKESALSNFIDEINKGKNIKESEMYRLMKDYLKEQYSLSEETPQKQEVSLPLNENVVNNQETSQEQNQTISKDTNKVMNEVQNYIKNNDLDMTTDEFVEWASNVELENEENMTEQQKELYSLISDIQNRASMEENNTRNNNIPNNVSIKDSQGREIDHNIHTYSTDAYEGQVNMRKEFQDEDGNTIAKIDYNYFDGEINVDVIETNPEYRRKGLATRLVKDLKQDAQEEGVKINYGYTSSDGTALLNAIEKEENIANNQEKIYNSPNEREGDYNGGKSENTINRINEETSRTTSNDGNKESTDGFSSTSQSNDNLVTEQQRSDTRRNKETGKDNKGRILTEEQIKRYKGDKARDEQGNLLVFYHSTDNDFNIYDKNKSGKNYNWLEFGDGFYFTPSLEMAKDYAEYGLKTGNVKIKEQYLDCKNPFYIYKKNNSEIINAMALEVENRYNKQHGTNLKINEFRKESGSRFLDFIKDSLGFSDKEVKQILQKYGYDGIDALEIKDGEYRGQYVVFEPNQIKNVDNLNPTDSPDIRYELEDTSNNTAENEIQRKINRSMTMEQAKDMVQRAFVTGEIYDWFDGQYKTGDEWLAGEGASDVALIIDNDFNLQNKYVNANEDILNEEYTIDDVIEAYQNGTLTGSSENQTQRLDTSKDTGYKDDRFYAPKDITGGKELYELASQRVTNKNRNEIYKARADFIINAHNEGYIESLGLNSKEFYEKLRSWTSYPKNALQTSMEINKGVSKENRWTGIENCSVVNELSVSKEQLDSLVKEIKGTSDDYQRRYISNTMLALDTHLNYKNLTFDFAPDATNMGDSVLGDYQPDYDVIRVKRDGQNTVSHEMGHYIDHLIGRELANGYNLGVTRLCRSSLDNMMNGTTFTQEQKQFLRNFANFLEDIENSSDIGSSYKMSSDEVFARFVARFTEWTRNVATGNRYGYEAKWYDDHFNQSQYKEFAKLLQEYSLLKTTEQASGRSTTLASQRTGQIQEQKIEDIFNELNKKKKTQENTEQSQKVQLPMKEKQEVKAPLKQGNVQQNQNNNSPGENINWNEIERPEENRKFRKHYKSIIESDNTTAEAKAIAKELMKTDTYVPETNKGQLAQADERIMTSSPEAELQSLRSRVLNGERITSVDIAVGERLIQYFSKTGSAEQLQDAIQTTALAGTSTGQTLQALTILNHQTPQGQVTWIQRSIEKINKELAKKKGGTITKDEDGNLKIVNKQGKDITDKVKLFDLTPEMMNKIMQSENQEQMLKNIDEVYEELGQQVPKDMIEKIDSWRYFSMLANARTHIRNMVGNVAMGKMQRVKDKIAGGIEDVVSKFNPEMERTKTLRRADKKAKEFAKNDFKNVEVQSRLELNESKFKPQSRLQNARRTFKSDVMENTLGRLFDLNDTLLEAEDGLGLKAGYQKALADYLTANKIDVDNITDAQLGKARNYAIQQAKEATFHQANALASWVSQIGSNNWQAPKGKMAKFFVDAVLPFKKTPMNVAKSGVEYSPVGLLKSAIFDTTKLRKGDISVNQYIDNISKGLTGTGIALTGYALAKAGILKASGGDDKDKEKYDEEQGKQSYSIEIGGKTYSLDWLAPTGIPLFVGAETYKLFNQTDTEKSTEKSSEEDKLKQAIKSATNLANAGATAINPMSEMSMISGLTSALSSYNTSDNLGSLGNMMTNMGKSYINQFFPTLMGQVAKTGDEYERTTKSTATGTIGKAVDQTINQIKNKVPGLRQTLPIKTDIWGKEVKQEVNLPLRAVNNFINPATVKEVSTDKVDMELNKLYEENHSSSLLPDILTKTIQLNKQTYRLSNKEYAEFTKNYGQTSHKLIENFIKTSDYNKLTQEQKETAISNIYSYAKEQNKLDYAKKVNEEVKPSTLYTTMKEIEKGGGKQSEYLSYLAKTKGISKENEKNKVLADSNYSNKTKEIIYTNGTGKDDNLYNNLLSKSNIDMTEYLKYKNKLSEKAFGADKDKNGKTIAGSAKTKVINYLNNNITGVGNRLLIAGKSYALQNSEKQKLAEYINQIANTKEDRISIYKQLDKNFYVRNEKVYMRVSK